MVRTKSQRSHTPKIDTCIDRDADCNCSGSIFPPEHGKWCCHSSPCEGRGRWYEGDNFWKGEENKEGIRVGAICNGTVIRLNETCRSSCNFYPEDEERNTFGSRSHAPCTPTVPGMNTTQCYPEAAKADNKFDCDNRVDENPFKSNNGTSSIPINISSLLQPCHTGSSQGYKCSGYPYSGNCLPLWMWCDASQPFTCTELNTTTTQLTTDTQICSDQIVWEGKICAGNYIMHRCTGKTPGQCSERCSDGSDVIVPPKEGLLHCGEELKCVGRRDSKWEGLDVCIEDRYKCDEIVQCEGKEDEMGCSEFHGRASKRCEGNGSGYQCDNIYKQPAGDCGENLKCIARDGRFMGFEICVPNDFICDNTLQCQGGEDEDKCEVRYIEKKIFSVDEAVVCTSRSLKLTKIGNGTGHFFPYRGGLSISLVSQQI